MTPKCDAHDEFHDFVVSVSTKVDVMSNTINKGTGALGLLMVICTIASVIATLITALRS